jgi:hypothetical protein
MALTLKPQQLARASLVTVWLGTALVSAWEARGQSVSLLVQAGIDHTGAQQLLIWGGVALDIALGFALLLKPSRRTYGAALAAMAGLTLCATWLSPSLWLHPIGPLLKNLPIAALLWWLMEAEGT